MCKYCDDGRIGQAKNTKNGWRIYHANRGEKQNWLVVYAKDHSSLKIPIKYCPHCGTRLWKSYEKPSHGKAFLL